jgi:hypothetical protein
MVTLPCLVMFILMQVAAAKRKLREAHELLGSDPKPVIQNIETNPLRYREHASPVNRALAHAVIKRLAEQQEERRLQLQAAEEAEREARLVARRAEDARQFARLTAEAGDVVRLDVGGELMATTKATLLSAPEGSPLEVVSALHTLHTAIPCAPISPLIQRWQR